MLSRDFQKPGRSVAISDKAMAATSHPQATLAAIDVLREGGNAVDAAVCAVALQGVIDPLMTGIGGDCFALLAMAGREPIALNGSGTAPKAASANALRAQGLTRIDPNSAHSVTIPGAADAWCKLIENHGKLSLARVLQPAIDAARNGFCITPRVAFDWQRGAERVSRHKPAAEHFLKNGNTPQVGERFYQPELGHTLALLAENGRSAFYEGSIARHMVDVLQEDGGVHTLDDFASFEAFETEPISAPYKDYELYECPPNGQGLAALMMVRILDGFDLASGDWSEADRIHLLAEATKHAYAMRDKVICDPDAHQAEIEALLSDKVITGLRDRIDIAKASAPVSWEGPEHKDTVYVTVVDDQGNACSLINSIFEGFGAGIYAPEAGVLFHCRGAGFSLHPGHANELDGGRRPFHTIIPAMLMKDGLPVMSFGVMGGHYQAIGHAHILSQIIDLGLDPQLANEAPRSFWEAGELSLETTIAPEVKADLEARGHKTVWATSPIGGCQAIWIDRERGILLGASDHRKDGMALGL